jgi:signal transduction protein with GAF and PtsI domain
MKRKHLLFVVAFAMGVIVTMLVTGNALTHEDKFAIFKDDLSKVTDKIVTTIQANPTAEGVATAHGILNQATPRLKQQISDLKALEQSNIRYTTLRQFEYSIVENRNKFKVLATKNEGVKVASRTDKQFVSGMQKLFDDYKSIIR